MNRNTSSSAISRQRAPLRPSLKRGSGLLLLLLIIAQGYLAQHGVAHWDEPEVHCALCLVGDKAATQDCTAAPAVKTAYSDPGLAAAATVPPLLRTGFTRARAPPFI